MRIVKVDLTAFLVLGIIEHLDFFCISSFSLQDSFEEMIKSMTLLVSIARIVALTWSSELFLMEKSRCNLLSLDLTSLFGGLLGGFSIRSRHSLPCSH